MNTNATPTEEEEVAYHEAGHAIVARVLGRRVPVATIVVDEERGSAGHVHHEWAQDLNELECEGGNDEEENADVERKRQVIFEHEAMVALAGRAAQRRFLGERANEDVLHETATSDRRFVLDMLDRLAGRDDDELRNAWWKLLELRTERLLTKHWPAVEYMASCLLERKTLTGEEIDECRADALLPTEHRGKKLSWEEWLEIRVKSQKQK